MLRMDEMLILSEHILNNLMINLSELGMRQFCHDNVTMFSGHKVVCNLFVIAILLYFLWLPHLDTEA